MSMLFAHMQNRIKKYTENIIHHAVPGRIFITLFFGALCAGRAFKFGRPLPFKAEQLYIFFAIFLSLSESDTTFLHTQTFVGKSFLAPNAPPMHTRCEMLPRHVVRQNSNWQGAILGVAQKNALTHTHTQAQRANLVGALKVAAP